ncbi:MAG TPA: heme-binding protein, partial [Burkholderiales bacterium]|nr:heme-binding protein [Burkholderiales bacterium]
AMSEITLEQSERIIDAVLARGRELNCRPLAVAVTDPGAHVKAFKKEDDSAMMRFEMAMGKAYAALALRRSSSLVRVRNEEKPQFMSYLINASGGKIFPEGGGRLIRNERGEVIGAVGVTGDTETRDEDLAAHGIRAAGLKTDEDCENLGHSVRLKN